MHKVNTTGIRASITLMVLWLIVSGICYATDYLIVSHPDFADTSLQRFADWRTSLGYPAHILVPTDPRSSFAIKSEMLDYISSLSEPPDFILMVGADNLVMGRQGGISTDCYYADFDGDGLSDAFIGRWPVRTISNLRNIIDKTIRYTEDPSATGSYDWLTKGSLTVRPDGDDNDYLYWHCIFHAGSLMVDNYYSHIDTFSTAPPYRSVGSDVVNALNDGRGFLIYRGQGVENWWGYFVNPDTVDNSYMTPIISSATCKTIGSYGPAWLNTGSPDGNKGAVAYMGTNTTGGGRILMMQRNAMAFGFSEGLFAGRYAGEATEMGRRKVLEIDAETSIREYNSCHLLGDPALRMWTKQPQRIVLRHNAVILPAIGSLAVSVFDEGMSPIDSALVCVWADGFSYARGRTDEDGLVLLPYDMTSALPTDTLNITASAHNFFPARGFAMITPEGAFPHIYQHWFDDTTHGTPDGFLSRGERVLMRFKMTNYGTETAEDIQLTLRTSSMDCIINDSTIFISSLPVGDSLLVHDHFDFTVSMDAGYGNHIDFEVEVGWAGALHPSVYSFRSPQILTSRLVITDIIVKDDMPYGDGNGIFEWGENLALIIEYENQGEVTLTNIETIIDLPYFFSSSESAVLLNSIGGGEVIRSNPLYFSTSPLMHTDVAVNLHFLTRYRVGAVEIDSFWASTEFNMKSRRSPRCDYGYNIVNSLDFGNGLRPDFIWHDISHEPSAYMRNLSENDYFLSIVDIPFDFQYYGNSFDEAKISTKGYIDFSGTFMVYSIPYEFPFESIPFILAGAWTDFMPSTHGGAIYSKYLPDDDVFIIQFVEVSTGSSSPKSFQMVLASQDAYPTPTGDNEIYLYYRDFADDGNIGIGIQGDDMGYINYLHRGEYHDDAVSVHDGIALRITTSEPFPAATEWLVPKAWFISDIDGGNGNGIIESGERIDIGLELANVGTRTAEDVSVRMEMGYCAEDIEYEIIDSICDFGTIRSGGSNTIIKAFVMNFGYLHHDSEIRLDFYIESTVSGYRTSAHINILAVSAFGISEPDLPLPSKNAMVYPNPFNSAFTLDVSEPVVFTMTDITGRVIIHQEATGPTVFSLDYLDSGLYLYKISFANGSSVSSGKIVHLK